jgi:hypothetical protein
VNLQITCEFHLAEPISMIGAQLILEQICLDALFVQAIRWLFSDYQFWSRDEWRQRCVIKSL